MTDNENHKKAKELYAKTIVEFSPLVLKYFDSLHDSKISDIDLNRYHEKLKCLDEIENNYTVHY